MRNSKNIKGFTLVELLVVIAIIALLLAIVIPSISKAKDYVKRTVCNSNVRQIGIALQTYVDENDGYLIPMSHLGGANPGKDYDPSLSPGESTATTTGDKPLPFNAVVSYSDDFGSPPAYKPFHMAKLYDGGYMDDAETFYCPAQPRTPNFELHYDYDFYTSNDTKEWGTWIPPDGTPPQGNLHGLVRTSYNYWTHDKKRYLRLGSVRPIVVDNLQHWEVIPHRKNRNASSTPQGVTALFADGHVNFCVGEDIFSDQTWTNPVTGAPLNQQRPRVTYDGGPGNSIETFEKILKAIQAHQ